jgi:hypothetical protein
MRAAVVMTDNAGDDLIAEMAGAGVDLSCVGILLLNVGPFPVKRQRICLHQSFFDLGLSH